jgi:hypothetical protein
VQVLVELGDRGVDVAGLEQVEQVWCEPAWSRALRRTRSICASASRISETMDSAIETSRGEPVRPTRLRWIARWRWLSSWYDASWATARS